ncbi:MAG: hypothetical protein HY318_13435 [Armatimonadetes bacterium]|nr:hypothetical protein [Armatimonadota bacterium]
MRHTAHLIVLLGWMAFCFLTALLCFHSLSDADGIAFEGSMLAGEGEQKAAILHNNGLQKMVIAVQLHLAKPEKAVWIVPIPSKPDRIRVDLVSQFPVFDGRNTAVTAMETIVKSCVLLRATQIYPVIVDPIHSRLFPFLFRVRSGIQIPSQVEKWGLHSEVVSAESINDLLSHLKEQGVTITGQDLTSLQPYLSERYSLILTWIGSRKELLKAFPDNGGHPVYIGYDRWPALYLEFPTKKAYYPLRPTRAYGDKVVPVNLWLFNYFEAQTAPALPSQMETSYFRRRQLTPQDTKPFKFSPHLSRYTRVELKSSARYFTQDLWFSPNRSCRLACADGLAGLGYAPRSFSLSCLLPILALLSYVSAGLAGLILFGEWKRTAAYGLLNLLTIVGMWLVIHRLTGEPWNRLKSVVVRRGVRIGSFTGVFSVVFVLLTVAGEVVLVLICSSIR